MSLGLMQLIRFPLLDEEWLREYKVEPLKTPEIR